MLLSYLKFLKDQSGISQAELPRFRYCFYLDFLSSTNDANTENALAHLREQAEFVRVLGSYPAKSRLVGPIAEAFEQLKVRPEVDRSEISLVSSLGADEVRPLNIGIIGFGAFGQTLATRMKKEHRVSCMDQADKVRLLYSTKKFAMNRSLTRCHLLVPVKRCSSHGHCFLPFL